MAAHGYQRTLKQCPEKSDYRSPSLPSHVSLYLCFKLLTHLLWKIHYYKAPFMWQAIQLKNHIFKLIQRSMNFDGVRLFVELHEVVTQRFPSACLHIVNLLFSLLLDCRLSSLAQHIVRSLFLSHPPRRWGQKEARSSVCLLLGCIGSFPRSDVLWLQGGEEAGDYCCLACRHKINRREERV